MTLRHPSVHDGQHQRWNVSLLWSLVVELVEARAGTLALLNGLVMNLADRFANTDVEEQKRLVQLYNAFVDRVVAHELTTRAFAPPLLDVRFW